MLLLLYNRQQNFAHGMKCPASAQFFINEHCTTNKSSLQLENPESKMNTSKGYFFAPPAAACLSSAFFCFSLIIAASLNTTREKTPW